MGDDFLVDDNPYLDGMDSTEKESLKNNVLERMISFQNSPKEIKNLLAEFSSKIVEVMYNGYINGKIPKEDPQVYNSNLWMLIKTFETMEDYDKCEKLKTLFI